ncbi:MAG: hypothetical protein ACLP9L_30510 [Thermoguttaceae bacterium]
MYERFTDRARKVMQLANQEARRFPSSAQYSLAAAMIATSIYAWKQKYYFEE